MRQQAITSFILIIFVFLFSACDKEEVSCIDDCKDDYLSKHGMVSYSGQEIGCKTFVSLYEYKNKQYYVLGNHCADMVVYPTDCTGNKLCESGEDNVCKDFYKNAKYIGVVGIKE